MTVNHPAFGKGQIVHQDANNVTVDFNGTIKIMVIKYAKLTNEDGTPFGEQAAAPVKKTKSTKNKMYKFEQSLSEERKRELSFQKPDGSYNQDAIDKFMDEQEKKKKEAFYGKYSK